MRDTNRGSEESPRQPQGDPVLEANVELGAERGQAPRLRGPAEEASARCTLLVDRVIQRDIERESLDVVVRIVGQRQESPHKPARAGADEQRVALPESSQRGDHWR